jgi:hypothetical protein
VRLPRRGSEAEQFSSTTRIDLGGRLKRFYCRVNHRNPRQVNNRKPPKISDVETSIPQLYDWGSAVLRVVVVDAAAGDAQWWVAVVPNTCITGFYDM